MTRRTAQVDQLTGDQVLCLRAVRDCENLTDREVRLVIKALRDELARRTRVRDARANQIDASLHEVKQVRR